MTELVDLSKGHKGYIKFRSAAEPPEVIVVSSSGYSSRKPKDIHYFGAKYDGKYLRLQLIDGLEHEIEDDDARLASVGDEGITEIDSGVVTKTADGASFYIPRDELKKIAGLLRLD